MVFVNLNDLSINPEDFVLAKRDIESEYIEKKLIKEKMSIQDFVSYIDLSKSMFINKNDVLPFAYITTANNSYIIYASTDTKSISLLTEYLEKIKYDFSRLTKRSNLDVINGILSDKPYFLLNGDFYN